jgi:hypothetical protein
MADVVRTPGTLPTSTQRNQFQWARAVNIVLGIWLFLSAFLWTHSAAQMRNTWVCGVLIAAFAAVAFAVPVVRYLNTALAVWLFISAFALPSISQATIWNNALVAIAVFVFSLVPAGVEGGRRYVGFRRRVTA